ncbi:hypothetical protein BVRB_7g165160 [Beta vulgaris subsp. vulgaris]|nr:hypothetical protein BVRB_7g165160 [Beta vulgaris subsp. vulgaris]
MMEEDNEPDLMVQDDPNSPETIEEDDDVGIDDPYMPACEERSPSFVQNYNKWGNIALENDFCWKGADAGNNRNYIPISNLPLKSPKRFTTIRPSIKGMGGKQNGGVGHVGGNNRRPALVTAPVSPAKKSATVPQKRKAVADENMIEDS